MDKSINDLLSDAALPTENREPQAFTEFVDVSTKPTEAKVTAEKQDEPEEQSSEMIEAGADLTIGIYDLAQTSIFRMLIKRRKNRKLIDLYGESALIKLEKLTDEQEANSSNKIHQTVIREFTPDELGMLRIAKSAEEVINDLALGETEINCIKIPLMQIMKLKGGTLPPEYMLLLAVLQTSGARAGEMFMI